MAKKEVDLSEFAFKKGNGCSVGDAVKVLPPDKREKVLAALASPEIRHSMIAKRLSEWQPRKINGLTIARHRNKECSCE